jgi:hypothetical protein
MIDLFVVRLWDGMDGIWMDVSEHVSKEEADRIWNEKTAKGTKATKYADIDYYCIFPADTTMLYRSGQSLMGLEDRHSRQDRD